MKLVRVVWEDAFGDEDRWMAREEIASSAREVTTVGWEIDGANEGHVVIAGSRDEETDSYGHIMHIPKAMVRKKTSLT